MSKSFIQEWLISQEIKFLQKAIRNFPKETKEKAMWLQSRQDMQEKQCQDRLLTMQVEVNGKDGNQKL